jgi:dTDP-4-amino-4,6-dideoxygalactose transaminase
VPLHKQKAYAKANVDSSAFSVTNQLVKEVISLPMHSELSIDQIEYICDKILCFFD